MESGIGFQIMRHGPIWRPWNKRHVEILTQSCPKRTPQRLPPRKMDLHPCRSAIACKTTMSFLGQNDIWRVFSAVSSLARMPWDHTSIHSLPNRIFTFSIGRRATILWPQTAWRTASRTSCCIWGATDWMTGFFYWIILGVLCWDGIALGWLGTCTQSAIAEVP